MIRRLNIKLIGLFFIALWLFEKAGEVLGFLRNPTLVEQIRQAKGNTAALSGEGVTVISIMDLELASGLAAIWGLLVGLVIALLISEKRRWHWLNPVLALVLVYLTGRSQIDNASYIVRLIRMPSETLNGAWYYVINGLVSILLGLLTFIFINSMKRPNNNQHLTTKQQSA